MPTAAAAPRSSVLLLRRRRRRRRRSVSGVVRRGTSRHCCHCCYRVLLLVAASAASVLSAVAADLSDHGAASAAASFLALSPRGCRRRRSTTSTTAAAMASEEEGSDDEEARRMEAVRRLQEAFYKSSGGGRGEAGGAEDGGPAAGAGGETMATLDVKTGRILNLPLWRVGWVEVPGRTNCLNVHEGHYTNMFEKLIRKGSGSRSNSSSKAAGKGGESEEQRDERQLQPLSMCFGHLYLPGGTKSSRGGERRFQLKSWREEVDDDRRFDERERSAVVGCLMRIADYRRLQDGRLMLLVQSLERFVVDDDPVQSFPHAVAHVQILPDVEEVEPNDNESCDENFARVARARAVRNSFQYYFDYECDLSQAKLPFPPATTEDTYLSPKDVLGSEIAKLLPFCSFASKDDALPAAVDSGNRDENGDDVTAPSFAGGEPSLESRLRADLILRNPAPLPGATRRETQDAGALETLLWLAMEEFSRNYGFPLPEEVLCLVPPDVGGAAGYLDVGTAERPVSDRYPAKRRQRRLSYAAPALVERAMAAFGFEVPALRQELLNAPGTTARLAAVLERFEVLNDAKVGQFE